MKLIKVFALVSLLFVFAVTFSSQSETVTAGSKLDSKQMMSDLRFLSHDAFKGRVAGSPENAIAREFIANRYTDLGLEKFGGTYYDKFKLKRRNKEVDGTNVVGFIKGTKSPDKYIVITAHFDHLGVRRDQIYNGADDNASGTVVLMAMADYFKRKRPQHSLIFAALDAEEGGLDGARHFVSDLPVEKSKVVLNVNLDMVSRADKNELYAAGTYHYPNLKPILEKVAKKSKVKLLFGHDRPQDGPNDWTNQSDHAAFHRAKIPFIYFGVEDHPDYHKPTDDFEKVNEATFMNCAETILMSVKALDKKFPNK